MNRLVILLAAALPVAAVAPAVGSPSRGPDRHEVGSPPRGQDRHDGSAECRPCVEDCVDAALQCREAADARFEECLEPCRLDPDAGTGADCWRGCRRTQRAENEVCDRDETACIGDCHPNPEPGAPPPEIAAADRAARRSGPTR